MKLGKNLDISIKELPNHYAFFLPLAGSEVYHSTNDNEANRNAAYKMAQLYDLLITQNLNVYNSKESIHNLNIFLSRLLFCFFAEDTEILIELGELNRQDFNPDIFGSMIPAVVILEYRSDLGMHYTWTGGNRFINSEVEFFVKGLHLIENKYKLETHNAFGFGSTSPSYKIIRFLKRTNETLASELEKWISLNRGNYYIKAHLSDKTKDNSKNQSSLFPKLEE